MRPSESALAVMSFDPGPEPVLWRSSRGRRYLFDHCRVDQLNVDARLTCTLPPSHSPSSLPGPPLLPHSLTLCLGGRDATRSLENTERNKGKETGISSNERREGGREGGREKESKGEKGI